MATIDLYIKTYKKDFWLLSMALETIKKNLTGYQNIILVVPEKDKHEFETRFLPERTLVFYITEPENVNGWIYQQVCKLKAHEYSFAEYICFSDSDAFIAHSFDLRDLIKDGKPEILCTPYEQLEDAIIWQEPTSNIIGEKVELEYMRRLGLVYHRDTLVKLNEWKPDLEETICKASRFSEFNLLGAFAHKFQPEKYTWTNTNNWTYVEPHFLQVWSHANKEKGASEVHHLEYIRLLETILKCNGINIPQR